MKNKTIIIRCTEKEYEWFKKIAKLNNLTISDMFRIAVVTTIASWEKKGDDNM